MRLRTVAAAFLVIAVLGGVVVLAFGGSSAGGAFEERWISDTPRDNVLNHHAVGVGPDGETVVAPVSAVAGGNGTLTDESCQLVRLDRADGAVLWDTRTPAEQCFTHALTEPAIADVDADDDLEVATATTEEVLVVRDAETGDEQYRVNLSSYGYPRPTVANVTPAPGKEIVVTDIKGGLAVVERGGDVAWRAQLASEFPESSATSVFDAPIVADVDADGDREITVGTSSGLVVLNTDGEVEWTTPVSMWYVAVAQADDDPQLELFTALTAEVHAYDGSDGSQEWTRNLRGTPRIAAADDADGDGTVELLVGRVGGRVVSLNGATGETDWTTTVSIREDATVPAPVFANLSDEPGEDVVVVTETGLVVALDTASGQKLAAYERDVPIWVDATPANLDDDPTDEVLIRYGDGRVVALEFESG